MKNSSELENVSFEFKNNREIVLAAIILDPSSLKHASPNLQNDREIVLAAINLDPFALKYASLNLQDNKEIVLAAINQDPCSLKHASPNLQNDIEIVLAAINQDPYTLKYASPNLQNNKEIALFAIQKESYSIKFIQDQLKANKDIFNTAFYKDKNSLHFISENIISNNLELKLTESKINSLEKEIEIYKLQIRAVSKKSKDYQRINNKLIKVTDRLKDYEKLGYLNLICSYSDAIYFKIIGKIEGSLNNHKFILIQNYKQQYHLIYKSRSSISWRILYYDRLGHFGKGDNYVTSTLIHYKLSNFINMNLKNIETLDNLDNLDNNMFILLKLLDNRNNTLTKVTNKYPNLKKIFQKLRYYEPFTNTNIIYNFFTKRICEHPLKKKLEKQYDVECGYTNSINLEKFKNIINNQIRYFKKFEISKIKNIFEKSVLIDDYFEIINYYKIYLTEKKTDEKYILIIMKYKLIQNVDIEFIDKEYYIPTILYQNNIENKTPNEFGVYKTCINLKLIICKPFEYIMQMDLKPEDRVKRLLNINNKSTYVFIGDITSDALQNTLLKRINY